MTVEQLAGYCERAGAAGVTEIALTEHLFRFRSARDAVGDWWAGEDADPALAAVMARYWDDHARADLDAYVEVVLAAKAAGLPVRLGLEVDHYPGRMDVVGRLLEGYPFDVLLGSVHWLGTWLFDFLDDPTSAEQWGRRSIDSIWSAYTDGMEELAGSGTCDVLAHPDVVKVAGHRPADPGLLAELEARIAEAAAAGGMAAEVSSAGWRKPANEAYPSTTLLDRFWAAGVPVTTASDTHGPELVGYRSTDLRALVETAGYSHLAAFDARRRRPVPL
jgi:histidinol-phosphatase (PHP family)